MAKKIFKLSGEVVVDGLQGAIKGLQELGSQFQQAEKAFFKFGRQISSAGSKLTSGITMPIVAAAGAATLAAKAFGEYGDKILDMGKATGLSTDMVQELKQVASDTGTEFEGFIESIFKVTKNMPQLLKGSGEAAATLRDLGVNVFDASGKFRDMNVLFPEIIKKLQNIKGETDRTAAAQTIFGKGATAVLDILSMTNQEFDASRQKAHDLGLVMSGDALQAADAFRVAMNDATNQLVAMGRQATLELLPVFKDTVFPLIRDTVIPALKDMAEKVAEVARWFNDLDGRTKKIIISMVGFAASVGPVLLVGGKLIGVIAGVSGAIGLMRGAFMTFTAFMATNPLGIALIGIALLTTAIIGVVNALDKIKKKKAEIAADKSYTASAEEERKDNEENIRLWQERLNWLERQSKPTRSMIEEMSDLRQAIKDTNAVLGKGGETTPPIVDPEAEARRKAALEAEKRKQEEIARVNAEYSERMWQAGWHSDEENYQHERSLALQYVASIGGDVGAAAEALDKERSKKLFMEESERLRIKRESADKEKKIDEEVKENAVKLYAEKVNSYISMVAQIGSGIAGIFQQSTANKQQALDNQQQAERDAIENGLGSEKEKRKALEALDKKQDKQQRDMRRKAASESKKISVFESIINTASAVTNALASVAVPFNFIMAGIVGAMGAVQTGLIAAAPLPLAKGAMIRGGRGGILSQIGEGDQDEIVVPMRTGVRELAANLLSMVRDQFEPQVPGPFLAAAGAGGMGGAYHYEPHFEIGTFIGDARGLKELERRQLPLRNAEAQRKGEL